MRPPRGRGQAGEIQFWNPTALPARVRKGNFTALGTLYCVGHTLPGMGTYIVYRGPDAG